MGRVRASALKSILKRDPEHLTWIDVPEPQIVKETKDFGSAELLSGIITVAATYLFAGILANPFLISLVGPIVEKIGFFLWEAYKAFKQKIKSPRTGYKRLFKEGMKGGTANLIVDVCFHDPLYIIFMSLLLIYTNISPAFAAVVSFLAAVPVASAAKSGGGETLHRVLKWISRLKLHWEDYYETRFLVLDDGDGKKAFRDLGKQFKLKNYNLSEYYDVYYRHELPLFGSRLGLVRNRNVTDVTGNERSFTNVEFSYTLGKKRTSHGSEFNLFYAHKEKGKAYIKNPDRLPWVIRRFIKKKVREIRFDREIMYNHEIRIVLDTVKVGRKTFNIIEIKAYHESKEFFSAMQYLLRHGSVMTTTFSKYWIMKRLQKEEL